MTIGGDFSDYWGAPDGGAFRMDFAQLTLRKSIVHTNVARRGGVIYMEQSVLELDTVILRNNRAREEGGAIYSMRPRNAGTGTWDIQAARTIFQGNEAGAEGAGLFADATAVKLDNMVFTGNTAGLGADYHTPNWPWQTQPFAFIGSTVEMRVPCCSGLTTCACNGGGLMLRGNSHDFNSVVSEHNVCGGAKCNSACQNSPVIGPGANPDGACFCLESCTSSTDPITLSNLADNHVFAVGLGRFYDTAAADEFYFGGNDKTWTVTYPKPIHTIRVSVRNFELPAYEERLVVLDKTWDVACICHEACADGDTTCHDSCTAAHAPDGECSRLAVMTGTAGFSVTSQRINAGTSVSFRVAQDVVPPVSCVSLNALKCAAVNTNMLECNQAAGGGGACNWVSSTCIASDSIACSAQVENGKDACEAAGTCIYTAAAPGSPWYTRGGFVVDVMALTCNEAEPQCVPTYSDGCEAIITDSVDCLAANGGAVCVWENDACIAGGVTEPSGVYGAKCTGISLTGLSDADASSDCEANSNAPCTYISGQRYGCSNKGSCMNYRARAPRDGGGNRISWIYQCVCDTGFTGNDCSHPIVTVKSALQSTTTEHINLQTAIDAAPDGDTLTVMGPARLYGAGNAGLVFPARSLELRGLGPLSTAIDCTGTDRALSIQHAEGSLTVDSASGLCYGCTRKTITVSSLAMRNCVGLADTGVAPKAFAWPYYVRQALSRNGKGAGVFVETPADVSLVNLVVENNRAEPLGGSIYLSKLVNPGVVDDVLLHNSAMGGGMMIDGVRVRLDRTFLTNNLPAGPTITGATADALVMVTISGAPIVNGQLVTIVDIVGTMGTELLNGNSYYAKVEVGSGATVTKVSLWIDAAMTAGGARVSTLGLVYTSGGSVRYQSAADKNLMCSGTICPEETTAECAGKVVAEYHGALLNDEPDQFNCHCSTDCERAVHPALTVSTATLVSGNRVVVQGERLAIGADSKATAISLQAADNSWTMACDDPIFVRPEIIICLLDVGANTPAAGSALHVARSDGAANNIPLFAECGIDAVIDGTAVTTENGDTVTFRIRLKSQPLKPVSVPISAGLDAGGVHVGQASVSMVWFSTSDWNVYQTVLVAGLEDNLVRASVAYTITLGPTVSLDHVYGGNAGAASASFPLAQHTLPLLFDNLPFACPRVSETLGSDSMVCECAPGYTRMTDGSGFYYCAECPSGYYKTTPGNGACSVCPGDIATSVGTRDGSTGNSAVRACVCRPGYYAEPGTSGATLSCVECPLGTACQSWGYELAEVGVLPGYWRADAISPYVIYCSTPEHCLGAANMSEDAMCRPGTYGHQCHGCEEGWGRDGHLCELCATRNWQGQAASWFLPVLLVPYLLLALTIPPPATETMRTWYSFLPMAKVFINFLQMRLVMNSLYEHWSDPLRTMFNTMGALSSATYMDIPSVDCAFAGSASTQRYYNKVYLALLMPLMFTLPVFLWWKAVTFYRNPFKWNKPHPNAPGVWEWRQEQTRMQRWFVSCSVGAGFLTTPAAVRVAMGALVCDANEVSGNSYLRVDISIACDDAENLSSGSVTTFATLALIFYCLLIPAGMLGVLYKHRFNLSNTTTKKTYAYLFAGYRSKFAYWEVIVLLRTLAIMIAGSSVGSPVARIGAVLIVVQFGLLIHLNRSPHDEDAPIAARLETLSLSITALSLILSLVQIAVDDVAPHFMIELLQWIINLFFVFLCIAVLVGEIWEETGDVSRIPPKVNTPGLMLMSSRWYQGFGGMGGKIAVEQDDYQVSMLRRAMVLKDENEAKAKMARAAAKVTVGRGLGQAMEQDRARSETGRAGGTPKSLAGAGRQMSQSEEIVYQAKEKELTAQIDQMRADLEQVQRREKLGNAVNILGRPGPAKGPAKPAVKATSLTALRRTMDAHGGIQLGEGAFEDVGQPVDVGVQTIDTGITGGEGPGAAALFEAETCELEATLDLGEIGPLEASRVLESEEKMVQKCAQFTAEVSKALSIPLRRIRVLHVRLGAAPVESVNVQHNALLLRFQLFPSLRKSDLSPTILAQSLLEQYTEIGGDIYEGEILCLLCDLRLIDGPDGPGTELRRPAGDPAELLMDAIVTEAEGSPPPKAQTPEIATQTAEPLLPEPELEPEPEPEPEEKPRLLPVPPTAARPMMPAALTKITANRMVYTSSSASGPRPYAGVSSAKTNDDTQTLGTSTFARMFAESGAAGAEDSSDNHEPLVRVAADDGSENRDAVSDQVVQAIHGRGGRNSEVAAMHFLAARDAITGNQEQMRHLRSAIDSVRKGHKNWWGQTYDDVDALATAQKTSIVSGEADAAFKSGALPAALGRGSLGEAEEVSPPSPAAF